MGTFGKNQYKLASGLIFVFIIIYDCAGKDHQERGKGQFQVQREQIGSVQRRHFM